MPSDRRDAINLSWAERAAADESLRVFTEAEVARAVVERDAALAEARHWRRVAEALTAQLQAALPRREVARRANQQRQVRHRRRHQFAPPTTEGLW